MAKKNYTKEEIKQLLKKNFVAESVIQSEDDYEDEFHVLIRLPDDSLRDRHFEVVSTMTAITNEEDFESNKNKFLKDIIEALINEEEENARLSSELKSRINEIKKANKDYAMQKLIAWVIHQTLERDNILISDKNAEPEAIRLFEEAKKYGRIDELNRVVGA